MMMTQSYYGGEYDSYSRPGHRAPPAAHYDRAVPYTPSYYTTQHHDLRSEYASRPGGHSTGTIGEEPSSERSARRRIPVACGRCRRRKIKCTGDPGNGKGCLACESAGAEQNSCVFDRVGTLSLNLPDVDPMPSRNSLPSATPTTGSYSSETVSSTYDPSLYQPHHRSSFPMLPTRVAIPDYDSYSTSPVADYTYAASTLPRHPSYPGNYNAENFRSYHNTSVPAPTASSGIYYEPGTAFSFGNLQAVGPFPVAPMGRLPSVTAETSLDMGSLHSSLPTQTVQERRLPIPYTQAYQPPNHAIAQVPQIRPLGSFSEPQARAHISGIHSHSSMPWAVGSTESSSVRRNSSVSSLATPLHHGLPVTSSGTSSSSIGEPILGYQFGAATGSPELSPIAGPALSESFSSTSGSSTISAMLPPASNFRFSEGSSNHGLTTLGATDDVPPRPSSSREAAASLYSFSAGIDNSDRSSSDRHAGPSSTGETQLQLAATPQHGYPPIRHHQPQHAASHDELRRRPSYDQRAATSHRMSVSNLNAQY